MEKLFAKDDVLNQGDDCPECPLIKDKIHLTSSICKSQCTNCRKEHVLINCPRCKKINPYKGVVENHTLIECLSCKKKSAIYFCPNERCKQTFLSSSFCEGYIIKCCECSKEFQQVKCKKCERLILYYSEKNIDEEKTEIEDNKNKLLKISKFIEGQVINCPYEDCNISFCLINCFDCFTTNKFLENKIIIGDSIVCNNEACKKKICKLFCFYCCRMLWYKEGHYYEGRKVKCPYPDCEKNFWAIKCPKCIRFNMREEIYHISQPTICCYEDCRYEFSKLCCPHCADITEFKETKFRFGANNRCLKCNQEFTFNICTCFHPMTVKVHYSEAQGIKCINESCKKDSHNGYCPHCDNIVILNRQNYRFGMTIQCPWINCRKKFNYLYCRRCGKGIYIKDNSYFEGEIIMCQDTTCKEKYQMISCGVCSRGIQYTIRNDVLKSELRCVYTDCQKSFYVSGIQNRIYHPSAFEFIKENLPIKYLTPQKMKLIESEIPFVNFEVNTEIEENKNES